MRRIPALGVAELRPAGDAARFALEIAREPGITRVEQTATRRSAAEPSLTASPEAAFQWQYAATHSDLVPEAVTHATAGITIAVIDTGADLAAPDLAAKAPLTYSVRTQGSAVSGPERPRHLRRLARRGLELERRRHRGQLRRRPSDGHRGG